MNTLSEEQKLQLNLRRHAVYAEMVKNAVWERYKLLPSISSLAATLLVVATFNENLLQLTDFVKILLAILLLLIPTSLIGFLYELNASEDHAYKKMEEIASDEYKIDARPFREIIKPTFRGYMPKIITYILSAVIFALAYLILFCSK